MKEPEALGLGNVGRPMVIFEGNAEEVVKRFPLNVNVAATAALAASRKPRVRVVANPSAKEDVHVLRAKGNFGKIVVTVRNKKMEGSLRTGLLAALPS